MINREYNNFELRTLLSHRDKQIALLRSEYTSLKKENTELRNWNVAWQKYRWNQRLIRQADCLYKEIKDLSDVQTEIFTYLVSLHSKKGERHVRGIARQINIHPATVCMNLKRLQSKGLVRAYLRHSNKKKFYTLPESNLFLRT